MSETPPVYVTTRTPYVPDRLDGLTDWERVILLAVGELRSKRKGAIILYDERTNTVRVYDGRALTSAATD